MTLPTGHLTDAQAQMLVDGALSEVETHELELHAAGCPGCGAAVESYRLLASALEQLEIPPLPDDFTDAVLARIDERERSAARERHHALTIFAGVVAASLAAFVFAGSAAWAPVVSSIADGIGGAVRVLQIGDRFVPVVVGALRTQIVLVASLAALPLLLALSRLVPAPRAETI